jgi:multidrug efflux system membrane fusion protein
MRKGWTVAVGFAVLATAVGVALPHLLVRPTPAAAAEKPAAAGPTVPVTAGTVAVADVPVILQGIGTVQAYNMVTIRSRVDGQIVKVDFTEGQAVKVGAPLFQIDPRPYQATLDQAIANQEKDKANLANAQVNFARDAQIIGANLAVSRQQYDNDKATVAADQAMVDADKAQIETAQINVNYSTIA